MRSTQVFYTWVKAGESLDVSFAKIASENRGASSFDPVIEVRDQSNAVIYSCASITHVSSVGTGCDFAVTATSDGTYSVTIAKSNPTSSSSIGQVQMSWSIDVSSEGVPVPGRTWSERFAMSDGLYSVINGGVDLSLWYQSEQGYTYRADRLGMQGIDSIFESNAFGNMDVDTCTSAYRSLFSDPALLADSGLPYRGPTSAASEYGCDFTPYKIFFEAPAGDLPAAAVLPGGEQTWLVREPVEPELGRVAFAPDGPGARSGAVNADVANFEGTLNVLVDVDNDGVFNGSLDRTLSARVIAGELSAAFDGRDANGDEIPMNVPLAFSIAIDRTAEIHFTDNDLELLPSGLQVVLLNGQNPGPVGLSWNDEWVNDPANDPQLSTKCSTTPQLRGDNVSSVGGVHGWDIGSCTGITAGARPINTAPTAPTGGSWGNNRSIDSWAFAQASAAAVIDYPGLQLSKTADPSSGTELSAGDVVAYTVTAAPVAYAHPEVVTPGLEATVWSGRYTDDVTDVRDNADVPLDDLLSSPAQGSTTSVDDAGDRFTWTGIDIPLSTSVATTYSATVRPVAADGDLRMYNIAFAHSTTEPPRIPEVCEGPLCAETTHPLVPFVQEPAFVISKTADPVSGTTVRSGDTITYTVTGTNTGNTPLNPVTLTDDLSGVLDNASLVSGTLTTSTGAPATLSGTTLSWTGVLPVGESVTIAYTVQVAKEIPASTVLHNVVAGSAVPTDPGTPETPGEGDPIVPPGAETSHPVTPTVVPGGPSQGPNLAVTGDTMPIGLVALGLMLLVAGYALHTAKRSRRIEI